MWLLLDRLEEAKRIPAGTIIIPKVKRIYSSLLAKDVVGVQPMSTPSGIDCRLKVRYGNRDNK